MTQEGQVLRASEGKVLKRKGTEEIFGNEIYLGYSYYIGGVKLEEPHLDVADDFEEVYSADYSNPSGTEAEELLNIITGRD